MATYGARVLIKILLEEDAKKLAAIKPEWLFDEEKDIYNFITRYLIRNGTLPSLNTCANKFDLDYDSDEISPAFNYLLDEMKNNVSRVIKLEHQQRIDDAKTERARDHQLVDMSMKLSKFWHDDIDLSMTAEQYKEHIETGRRERLNRGSLGLMSGFRTYDDLTGGLQGKEVYLILGRLKQGKTQLLLTMARNIALNSNRPALIWSMEMPKDQMYDRLFGMEMHINPNILRNKQVSDFGMERVRSVNVYNNINVIEGQFSADIASIGAYCSAARPSILFIDGAYLLRMRGTERMQGWERMAEIMKEVKLLVHNLNIPAVLSFQINRTGGRSTRGNANTETVDRIQLSDSIGQIMTSGLALYNDPESEDRKVIEILRGRHGEDGEFYINWNWTTMDFSEIRLAGDED